MAPAASDTATTAAAIARACDTGVSARSPSIAARRSHGTTPARAADATTDARPRARRQRYGRKYGKSGPSALTGGIPLAPLRRSTPGGARYQMKLTAVSARPYDSTPVREEYHAQIYASTDPAARAL